MAETSYLIDSPHLVEPDRKFRIADLKADDTGELKEKKEAAAREEKSLGRLSALQDKLYAQASHAVLIVLQAMDGGGKDGTIKHVFSGVNPQGCEITSFKEPTKLELAHDFLWRIHAAVPRKGMIGIFNRSHYESVLVERVKELAPRETWSRRYDQINNFERMLACEGTLILKFFLNISFDEQKRRMERRLADPRKNWKFDPEDLKNRARWNDYMSAYQDALRECSTPYAPWYAIPADHKWYRNWAVSDIIGRALEKLDPRYPPPLKDAKKIWVK